jgi:Fic family protein
MTIKKPLKNISSLIWQQADWPSFAATNPAVRDALLDARRKQGEVLGQANAIGLRGAQELIQSAYIQEVISTSAIEGEFLNPESVRSSVLRKLGVQVVAENVPHSARVDGLVDIVQDALKQYQHGITQATLFRWHRSIFSGAEQSLRRITVGQYRVHEDPMQIVSGRQGKEIVHYTAPPSAKVRSEMQAFLEWFEKTAPNKSTIGKDVTRMDGLERAAIAHLWFESIHPFEDGNGRIGRAIVDMAMAQDANSSIKLFSLSEEMLRQRKDYYDALNSAQHGDMDVSGWVIWFAGICAQACITSCNFMNNAIQRAAFWDEHERINLNERQKKLINRLLDAGDGGFLGGVNAEKYIKITSTSKATATRDLSELVAAEMLFVTGQGKALRYYINMPTWGHGVR